MQDRFKFRAVLHQNKHEEYQLEKFSHQRVFDVMSINLGIEHSTIEIIAEYPNGDWAVREIEDKDIDLIQCIGLKDKNGKLIYEGDIVKIEYYDFEIKHRIGIVEWEDDGFCITYHNQKDTKVSGCSLVDIVNGDKQEVIGNIYENPELLENK